MLNKLPILLCCLCCLTLSVNTAALVVALSAPTLSQSCYKVKGKSKVVLVHAIKVYGRLLEVLLPLLVTSMLVGPEWLVSCTVLPMEKQPLAPTKWEAGNFVESINHKFLLGGEL